MKIKMYQVDAFTNKIFGGNPAAVCLLDKWLPDGVMQSIAAENNLPETAFIVFKDGEYFLRWFTPTKEVDLCGHATLASAYVIFKLYPNLNQVIFNSLSGPLTVVKEGANMKMNFPALSFKQTKITPKIINALNVEPVEVYRSTDYLVIVESVAQLKSIKPNFNLMKELDLRGVIVSAIGEESGVDFVSRFFGPKLKIDEDPITGSAHCVLVPYWSSKLNKKTFHAHQISEKNIKLECSLKDDRVFLTGEAALYLEGDITISGH